MFREESILKYFCPEEEITFILNLETREIVKSDSGMDSNSYFLRESSLEHIRLARAFFNDPLISEEYKKQFILHIINDKNILNNASYFSCINNMMLCFRRQTFTNSYYLERIFSCTDFTDKSSCNIL